MGGRAYAAFGQDERGGGKEDRNRRAGTAELE
jgi:hypothetical protein